MKRGAVDGRRGEGRSEWIIRQTAGVKLWGAPKFCSDKTPIGQGYEQREMAEMKMERLMLFANENKTDAQFAIVERAVLPARGGRRRHAMVIP